MPELFRETLLEGLGFEFPAFWMHDGLGAYDPGGGLFVTGRDTLRWGSMLLHGGRVDNMQVVSKQFLDDIKLAGPYCKIDPGSDIYKMLPVGTRYRSGFYVSPTDNPTAPIIAGVGAFGQWCLIDYKRKNVMVKLSCSLKRKVDSMYSRVREPAGHWQANRAT
jgi:CubicO group peptidase (beta-lactamase class C family)